MYIRARFEKVGYARLIGHLDLMKLFRRAIKRAGIRLLYSEGFNPSPRLSIGNPLPLGVASVCEYLEMETLEDYQIPEVQQRLNAELPTGIRILEMAATEDTRSIERRIRFASYELSIPGELIEADLLQNAITEILNSKSFEIIRMVRNKKTKKKEERTVDIRPLLENLTIEESGIGYLVRFLGSSVGGANLRCDMVVSAISKASDTILNSEDILFLRTGQFEEAGAEVIGWV